MAEADLDVVIRQTAKQQSKSLIAATKARREKLMKLAAGAKGAEARERYKLLAKTTFEQGTAAAKRLQTAADNAADSYARSLRLALAEAAAKQPAEAPKPVKPPTKKSSKKSRPLATKARPQGRA